MLLQQQLTSFKSMVDVGSQVYCQAIVEDASRIYLDVGLGFRVECDVMSGEASRAVRLRKKALQDQVQPELLTCAQEQHPTCSPAAHAACLCYYYRSRAR